ncbi:filamentous hemagglutinin [Paraburkholderia sp. MM5482-R1]|uniref:filamentous hemagglutinin n=1 Tax=unclassified Paraburkholderia TaxID=2615204 RepID=UPI003D20F4CC
MVNLGRISTSGGDVFLIARQAVVNAGTVKAPSGTVELAAGETVLLQDSASSRQVFVQAGSHGTVVNEGRIKAAQVSLQAADGNVYALAGSGTRIRATGTTTRDGHVWLVADHGQITQRGPIAAVNADGGGGTVDTQAEGLSFGRGAEVRAGQWNISTPAFTIDRAAAGALRRSLDAGTSVGVMTTGVNGATGDLDIASNLSWHGAASLTLAAYHNVSVTKGTTIANNGAGNLTLRADASGIDNGGSVVNRGTIDWSGSTGLVRFFYDMNGSSSPGTVLSNKAWTAADDSGFVSQFTAYKLVNSLSDLQNIALDFSGAYALGKDVNAQAPATTTGTSILAFPLSPFNGQLDGMGHTISNLEISASGNAGAPVGMFSEIGPAGVVRDLHLQANISGPATSAYYGLLAGISEGTIALVRTSGEMALTQGQATAVGGLVGSSTGTITRSASNADVLCTCFPALATYTGGLVGYNGGVVRQSYSAAFTSGNGAGGLVGENEGLVTQSYSSAFVTANNGSVGALVGGNRGTIEQSFSTARVLAPRGGGIAVTNTGTGSIANDVFWDTQATGTSVAVADLADSTSPGSAHGLTTAQMAMPASFGPTYDFSPNGPWIMFPGDSRPSLRWQQFGP